MNQDGGFTCSLAYFDREDRRIVALDEVAIELRLRFDGMLSDKRLDARRAVAATDDRRRPRPLLRRLEEEEIGKLRGRPSPGGVTIFSTSFALDADPCKLPVDKGRRRWLPSLLRRRLRRRRRRRSLSTATLSRYRLETLSRYLPVMKNASNS